MFLQVDLQGSLGSGFLKLNDKFLSDLTGLLKTVELTEEFPDLEDTYRQVQVLLQDYGPIVPRIVILGGQLAKTEEMEAADAKCIQERQGLLEHTLQLDILQVQICHPMETMQAPKSQELFNPKH